MPRRPRVATGGLVYHVLNRGAGRQKLFHKSADYAAFIKVLGEACPRMPGMRVLCFCLMPNHWHLVLWPKEDGELSEFLRLLTVTHTQRWHAHHHTAGTGPLYQGRFKSFPAQQDGHLLIVCRYVERNALRCGLVRRAEHWRWCSLWQREQDIESQDIESRAVEPIAWLLPMPRWPVDAPTDWTGWVNRAETPAELDALRTSVRRGRPFGEERWQTTTAKRLGLESTLRPRGRPRVRKIKDSRPL